MNTKTELPLELYKANLELQARVNKLIQETGEQWLDLGHRLIGDGIAESNAEIEEVLKADDWQSLATLPAESFWRQVQQRFGDAQAVTQIAVVAQNTFASGLQDAIRTWQQETAQTLGGITGLPGTDALNEMFKPWQALLQASVPAAAERSAPADAKNAAEATEAKGAKGARETKRG